MIDYQVIIIGAGISGLYCGINLQKNFNKILIVEQSEKCGGRIQTIYNKDSLFESGAGRFQQDNKLFFKLLEKFNLKKDIIKIGNKNKEIINSDCIFKQERF